MRTVNILDKLLSLDGQKEVKAKIQRTSLLKSKDVMQGGEQTSDTVRIAESGRLFISRNIVSSKTRDKSNNETTTDYPKVSQDNLVKTKLVENKFKMDGKKLKTVLPTPQKSQAIGSCGTHKESSKDLMEHPSNLDLKAQSSHQQNTEGKQIDISMGLDVPAIAELLSSNVESSSDIVKGGPIVSTPEFSSSISNANVHNEEIESITENFTPLATIREVLHNNIPLIHRETLEVQMILPAQETVRIRGIQCVFCRNHGLEVPKKGHAKCIFGIECMGKDCLKHRLFLANVKESHAIKKYNKEMVDVWFKSGLVYDPDADANADKFISHRTEQLRHIEEMKIAIKTASSCMQLSNSVVFPSCVLPNCFGEPVDIGHMTQETYDSYINADTPDIICLNKDFAEKLKKAGFLFKNTKKENLECFENHEAQERSIKTIGSDVETLTQQGLESESLSTSTREEISVSYSNNNTKEPRAFTDRLAASQNVDPVDISPGDLPSRTSIGLCERISQPDINLESRLRPHIQTAVVAKSPCLMVFESSTELRDPRRAPPETSEELINHDMKQASPKCVMKIERNDGETDLQPPVKHDNSTMDPVLIHWAAQQKKQTEVTHQSWDGLRHSEGGTVHPLHHQHDPQSQSPQRRSYMTYSQSNSVVPTSEENHDETFQSVRLLQPMHKVYDLQTVEQSLEHWPPDFASHTAPLPPQLVSQTAINQEAQRQSTEILFSNVHMNQMRFPFYGRTPLEQEWLIPSNSHPELSTSFGTLIPDESSGLQTVRGCFKYSMLGMNNQVSTMPLENTYDDQRIVPQGAEYSAGNIWHSLSGSQQTLYDNALIANHRTYHFASQESGSVRDHLIQKHLHNQTVQREVQEEFFSPSSFYFRAPL